MVALIPKYPAAPNSPAPVPPFLAAGMSSTLASSIWSCTSNFTSSVMFLMISPTGRSATSAPLVNASLSTFGCPFTRRWDPSTHSVVLVLVKEGRMSVAGGCLIREAEPGLDDDAVAALMVDYLTWAIERLAQECGVDEPPTHPSLVRDGLVNYRPPIARLILAECEGQPVGVGAIRTLRAGVVEVKRMYVAP